MKLFEALSFGIMTIACIVSIWETEDARNESSSAKRTLLNERIEHLRLKTALAIIGIEDVVEIKNNTAVEIIWIKKP